MLLLLLLLIFYIFCLCHQTNSYHRSAYYKVTKQSFRSVWMDAGRKGEYLVFQVLRHYEEQGARFLFNCYLPKEDGTTTEIDVLMIHGTGLYVFESKNYSGWIFGSVDQLNWTQSLENGEKHKFYNPIRQNQTHLKALAEFLEMPLSEFTSYIVFSERCTLKKVPENTDCFVVVRRPDMLRKLRIILKATPPKYTHEEIQNIADKLSPLTNKDSLEKQQHVENIQTKCPFCSNDLVLRKGKYGQFWGCSTYPKCRFTRPNK